MKNYTLYLVLLFLAGVVIGIRSEFNHRSKRFLTFYRRNSAVVQVRVKNIGIGNNRYITPAKALKFAIICFCLAYCKYRYSSGIGIGISDNWFCIEIKFYTANECKRFLDCIFGTIRA